MAGVSLVSVGKAEPTQQPINLWVLGLFEGSLFEAVLQQINRLSEAGVVVIGCGCIEGLITRSLR